MNTHQGVKADERTAAVAYKANTWGYNFITFALLIDIAYRGVFLDEAAWDLFALLFVSGAISTVYMARHLNRCAQYLISCKSGQNRRKITFIFTTRQRKRCGLTTWWRALTAFTKRRKPLHKMIRQHFIMCGKTA